MAPVHGTVVINHHDKCRRGYVSYATISQGLAEDVVQLCSSLGLAVDSHFYGKRIWHIVMRKGSWKLFHKHARLQGSKQEVLNTLASWD